MNRTPPHRTRGRFVFAGGGRRARKHGTGFALTEEVLSLHLFDGKLLRPAKLGCTQLCLPTLTLPRACNSKGSGNCWNDLDFVFVAILRIAGIRISFKTKRAQQIQVCVAARPANTTGERSRKKKTYNSYVVRSAASKSKQCVSHSFIQSTPSNSRYKPSICGSSGPCLEGRGRSRGFLCAICRRRS